MTNPPELPHDAAAERAVLGSCLIDRDAILPVAAILKPADFYRPAHVRLYNAILNLYHERTPTDTVTLLSYLSRIDRVDEIGGESYIGQLIAETPTSVHAAYYADIVQKAAVRRRMALGGGDIVRIAYDGSVEPDELLTRAEGIIQKAAAGITESSVETLGQAAERYVDHIDDGPPEFLTLGYRHLDERMGGLERGTVTVIAGRPSHGKSAFAFGAALNAGKRGKSVLVLSLEMSNEQLTHRALAYWSGIDSQKIRHRHFTDDERDIVRQSAQQLGDLPVALARTWGDDISIVTNQIRAYHAARRLDLLVIDGLWLLRWPGAKGNRVGEVGYISRQLKILSGELDAPILLVHQLNRAMLSRTGSDRTPQLSDLRESGDVEQDADGVIFIHRPGLLDSTGESARDYANIVVAKQRQGPVFQVNMGFHETTQTFTDYRPNATRTFST